MKNSSAKKKAVSKKSTEEDAQEPRDVKLREHTAFKYSEQGEEKGRVPVWVKQKTLDYERQLHDLQIELMKMQSQVRADGMRLVLLFEGRDAAGKGGVIKRMTYRLNPRYYRVVALGVLDGVEVAVDLAVGDVVDHVGTEGVGHRQQQVQELMRG